MLALVWAPCGRSNVILRILWKGDNAVLHSVFGMLSQISWGLFLTCDFEVTRTRMP